MKVQSSNTCVHGWEALRWDPMTWLLDEGGPGVRWRTLRDLVGRPADSPAVLRARGGANATDPIASLLARLQPDGSWAQATDTWSRYRGAGWRLVAATHWGADTGDPRMREGAAYLLRNTVGEGGLDPTPCVTARGLQSLAVLGQARDPRFEEALAWLEATAGSSSGPVWTCPYVGHRGPGGGCVVAAVAVLGVLLAAPDHRRPDLRDLAVAEVGRTLSARDRPRHLFRYGQPNLMRTDAAEILQVLARSGIAFDAAWRRSLCRLQTGQDEKGRWLLGEVGPPSLGIRNDDELGRPSLWVTVRAATAVLHYAVEAGLPRLFPARSL